MGSVLQKFSWTNGLAGEMRAYSAPAIKTIMGATWKRGDVQLAVERQTVTGGWEPIFRREDPAKLPADTLKDYLEKRWGAGVYMVRMFRDDADADGVTFVVNIGNGLGGASAGGLAGMPSASGQSTGDNARMDRVERMLEVLVKHIAQPPQKSRMEMLFEQAYEAKAQQWAAEMFETPEEREARLEAEEDARADRLAARRARLVEEAESLGLSVSEGGSDANDWLVETAFKPVVERGSKLACGYLERLEGGQRAKGKLA